MGEGRGRGDVPVDTTPPAKSSPGGKEGNLGLNLGKGRACEEAISPGGLVQPPFLGSLPTS